VARRQRWATAERWVPAAPHQEHPAEAAPRAAWGGRVEVADQLAQTARRGAVGVPGKPSAGRAPSRRRVAAGPAGVGPLVVLVPSVRRAGRRGAEPAAPGVQLPTEVQAGRRAAQVRHHPPVAQRQRQHWGLVWAPQRVAAWRHEGAAARQEEGRGAAWHRWQTATVVAPLVAWRCARAGHRAAVLAAAPAPRTATRAAWAHPHLPPRPQAAALQSWAAADPLAALGHVAAAARPLTATAAASRPPRRAGWRCAAEGRQAGGHAGVDHPAAARGEGRHLLVAPPSGAGRQAGLRCAATTAQTAARPAV
jgi:hypothetical protein